MKMGRERALLILLVLVIAARPAFSQNVWEEKPYQQWTISDVEKLLLDSPWAQFRDKGVYQLTSASPDAVIIRLRSALPLRQALARLRQLRGKYDKLSDAEKKTIDESTKLLLECPPCANNYVVALAPGPGTTRGVPTVLQTMSQAEAKLNVRITNELGETRELVHFTPPKFQGDEALFFFARFNSKSEPLIAPNTKKLIILFDQKIFNISPKMRFEFDVSKMLVNGVVAL